MNDHKGWIRWFVGIAVWALLLAGCKDPGDDDDVADDDAADDDTADDDDAADDDDSEPVIELGCDTELPVATAGELRDALTTAAPGTAIVLASGTYAGEFDVEVSGEEGAWICIRGPEDRSAILDGEYGVNDWQGVLTLEGRSYIAVENLEIRNTGPTCYGVLIGAPDYGESGCHHVIVRNSHVHDVGEEIIKIQGYDTHDILVEENVVHTNLDWSGIDVQGHWGGTAPFARRPSQIVIRRNLVYDIPEFAGVGNEVADKVHVYGNVVLGAAMGLDIGCGNYNLLFNNLVTSYAHFNELLADPSYTAIDLSRYQAFTPEQIAGFNDESCLDGIALSGNYRSLVFDNEVTDCRRWGDLIISYDHWYEDDMHNVDEGSGVEYGHRENLWFRNHLHDNTAYYTVIEFNKQDPGVSFDQMYFGNLFAHNDSSQGIIYEHSEGLLFFNNTVVDGDEIHLTEQSINARINNNLLYESGYDLSGDSTGADTDPNHQTSDPSVFVDYAGGDFRLDGTGGAACIDSGEDLSAVVDPYFQTIENLATTEYRIEFSAIVSFDLRQDLDGNEQVGGWDMGAFYGAE